MEEIPMSNPAQSLKDPSSQPLSRRSLVAGAGALVSFLAATEVVRGVGEARAADEAAKDPKYTAGAANKRHSDLVRVANDCVEKAEACLSHCFETFLAGQTIMASCAAAIDEMIPVCRALAHLAVRDSKNLALLAKACIGVCESCEKECRAHADHQAECRAAADACAALLREARKVAA
jgi:Cys-rich four helix bundle protein (predicted Tat secretion target)